ncbi:MAG: hypothetical protein Q9219_002307 [cf. Caloplaca sp. 3 TL-2023]
MPVRDRLRAAFVRKEASRICWRCEFLPWKPTSFVQVATATSKSTIHSASKSPPIHRVFTELKEHQSLGTNQSPSRLPQHAIASDPTSQTGRSPPSRKITFRKTFPVRVEKYLSRGKGTESSSIAGNVRIKYISGQEGGRERGCYRPFESIDESASSETVPKRSNEYMLDDSYAGSSSTKEDPYLPSSSKTVPKRSNEHMLDDSYAGSTSAKEDPSLPSIDARSQDVASHKPSNEAILHHTTPLIRTPQVPSRKPSTLVTLLFPGRQFHSGARPFVAKFHTKALVLNQLESRPGSLADSSMNSELPSVHEIGIRRHLELWQELRTKESTPNPMPDFPGVEQLGLTQNTMTQSTGEKSDDVSIPEDSPSSWDWELLSSSDKDDQVETGVHHYLRPGDVIGYRTPSEPMLAVFIRNFEGQAQFYSIRGRWFHQPSRFRTFTIRDVFSHQDISPIMPHLPDEPVESGALFKSQAMALDVPREVGAAVIEKLQAIQDESYEVYRQNPARFDRIYSLVADEHEKKQMTLSEIAMVVFQKENTKDLNNAMLWAVQKALMKDANFHQLTRGRHLYRDDGAWKVHPLDRMQKFEQVRTWIRGYLEGVIEQATSPQSGAVADSIKRDAKSPNPIPSFLRKVKTLIQKNRERRSLTVLGGIGPDSPDNAPNDHPSQSDIHISPMMTFKPMEKTIIEFMKSWCMSRELGSVGVIRSLPPLLLKAVALYGDRPLNTATAFLFLKEIGVVAPWENPVAYESVVSFPVVAGSSTRESVLAADSASVPFDEPIEDALGDLRKDWGDMTVYCIDSADAREIDDGISLEKISGDDSAYWVHIHVANPSAFIKPDSATGRRAAERQQTIYVPEQTYPFLDPGLTQKYFSLAADRPALTFSAKVALSGEIQDISVTPGRIRNIKTVTPQQLDHEFGLSGDSDEGNRIRFSVGHPPPSTSRSTVKDELSPSDMSELRTLQQLGLARRRMRTGPRTGAGVMQQYVGPVHPPQVYTQQGRITLSYDPMHGRQFIGDPAISWEAHEVDVNSVRNVEDTSSFVGDLMILAGEIAARWCSSRNIPAPYRGTIRDPAAFVAPDIYRSEVIDRAKSEKGYVPRQLRRTYGLLLGESTTRSHPISHAIIGTEAYVRATSPLRRYPDMLLHWQIQAALLYEADHGTGSLLRAANQPFTGTLAQKPDLFPFSLHDLNVVLPEVESRERDITLKSKRSHAHWLMQLLHRAFYFKESTPPLPERFDVLVHAEPSESLPALGYTKQLSGLMADLLENEVVRKAGGFQVDDWWETRIEGVDTYGARLRMEPVRLVSRVEGRAVEY